jgi:hypothetical protein
MKLQNLIHIVIGIVCIGLLPKVQALSPAPDGGYPGFTTAEGQNALLHLTTGTANTAVGWLSLESVTTGSFNTAVGTGTLLANTANDNTASGAGALLSNTTGGNNTANGVFALFSNTTGVNNTATGLAALGDNTTGSFNTASGYEALLSNTTGINNTADGYQALYSNTTGHENAANGGQTLSSNTTGFANTASGIQALYNNTTGIGNTANGFQALYSNTVGNANIALGDGAGSGQDADAHNNIYIGDYGSHGEVNTIAIGIPGTHTDSTYLQGVFGATAPLGSAVFVNSFGHLGTLISSARFKQNIRDMADASHALLGLRPVTFCYKPELDPDGIPQFGLVAEEVEKVNPALVVRDGEGKPYSVRYEQINAMLLNEFLKEHRAFLKEQRQVEEQEATISQLKSTVAHQEKGMEALAASVKEQALQIQNVSAQIELNKPVPKVVLKNR